jgi:hypothetical protein
MFVELEATNAELFQIKGVSDVFGKRCHEMHVFVHALTQFGHVPFCSDFACNFDWSHSFVKLRKCTHVRTKCD